MAVLRRGRAGTREQREEAEARAGFDRTVMRQDRYLKVERGTEKPRGKGESGGPYTRVVGDTSKFKLDEKRAEDPNNWEYWYKEQYGTGPAPGGDAVRQFGKNDDRYETRQSVIERRMATRAKNEGEIRTMELATAKIDAETQELQRVARESTRWTSSDAQRRIAQAKMMSRRRGGRASSRSVQRQTMLG